MTSGITEDGFQESLDDDKPPEPAPRPRRARRRWWPWGGAVVAAAEDAAEVAGTGEAAVATAPAGGTGDDTVPHGSADPDGPGPGSDLAPEDAVDELPLGPPDTTARDSFLAPDSEKSDAPEGGVADGATASDNLPETANADDEEQTLDAAREEEQRKREDALARHQDAVAEARQQARAEEEFARFGEEEGLDLLQGDPEDEEDPFDPNSVDYEMGSDTEYENFSSEPEAPSGPFGTPFGKDDVPESGSEHEEPAEDVPGGGYGVPETAEELPLESVNDNLEAGVPGVVGGDGEASAADADPPSSSTPETQVDDESDDPFGSGGPVPGPGGSAADADLDEDDQTETEFDSSGVAVRRDMPVEMVEVDTEDEPARVTAPVIDPEALEASPLPALLDDDSGLDPDDDDEVGQGFPTPAAPLDAGPQPAPADPLEPREGEGSDVGVEPPDGVAKVIVIDMAHLLPPPAPNWPSWLLSGVHYYREDASLVIDTYEGRWRDEQTGEGGTVLTLLVRLLGSWGAARRWLRENEYMHGLRPGPRREPRGSSARRQKRRSGNGGAPEVDRFWNPVRVQRTEEAPCPAPAAADQLELWPEESLENAIRRNRVAGWRVTMPRRSAGGRKRWPVSPRRKETRRKPSGGSVGITRGGRDRHGQASIRSRR